ncbi:uncharacterized protein [Henckelia pumila]|uniref:uncharacterized protein isoform X2 n=1 Tax=Henckelia pumila TaxID=405737 RepID=UPI003C6DCC79
MDSEDLVNDGVSVKGDCRECRRCLEMENEITKVNQKNQLLELEIEAKKNVIEQLEGKLGFMELKRLKFEDEVNVLKQSNEDLEMSIRNGERGATDKENGVVDLTLADDEEDKITKLVIENSVLECEKKKAECEIDGWKVKCEELEIQVLELQKRLLSEMSKKGLELPDVDSARLKGKTVLNPVPASQVQNSDEYKSTEDDNVTVTPPGDMPSKKYTRADEIKDSPQREFNVTYGRRVRKCLSFTEDKSASKSFSPSTPGGRPHVIDIDISDSDDNLDAPDIQLQDLDLTGRKGSFNSTDDGLGNAMYENKLTSKARCTSVLEQQGCEEEVACYNGSKHYLLTPKRRRVSKVVTSDSESDDNIPIGRLASKNQRSHVLNSSLSSNSASDTESQDKIDERITKQLNFAEMGASRKRTYKGIDSNNIVGTLKNESDEDEMKLDDLGSEDEMKLDDIGSEGESLDGFIVNSSNDSDCDVSAEDTSGESEDSLDSVMDYKEIMSGLRRESKHKMKWEFEADMLADFGKNPEICMKAVCALYRQQTSEEKSCKATINLNRRGFSQCDAHRGSALAEFLTDGEPQSDVKKSVEELLEFNPKGDELCRELAKHYSKQLFAIYHNGEDPFFKSPQSSGQC